MRLYNKSTLIVRQNHIHHDMRHMHIRPEIIEIQKLIQDHPLVISGTIDKKDLDELNETEKKEIEGDSITITNQLTTRVGKNIDFLFKSIGNYDYF